MICLTNKAKDQIKEFTNNFISLLIILFVAFSAASAVTFIVMSGAYLLGVTFKTEDITIMFYAGIMAIPVFLLVIFIALEWLYNAFERC